MLEKLQQANYFFRTRAVSVNLVLPVIDSGSMSDFPGHLKAGFETF